MKYSDVPALSRLVLRFHLILFLAIAPKLAATTTNFFDGFENGMIGWSTFDANIASGLCYWGVVDSSFGGRRIVIFSGGAKGADEKIFEECQGIRDGGGFGSIIGRNSFQRPKAEALEFLAKVMKIYS